MHHSNILHFTKRNNILKNRIKSGLISCLWIVVFVGILSFLINFSTLDRSQLLGGFLISLFRMAVSYVISATIAIIIALLITSNKFIENLFLPVLDVLQSFPSFALFPLFIVVFRNSSELVIITVLSITIIWPILFSIIGGVKNRRGDWEEAATIFGAKGLKRLVHFTIPQLLPSIVTGSIVGWGEGWEFIIGAELLVKTNHGIGYYLGLLGSGKENIALAFGIVVLLILLFIINRLIWLPLLSKATSYSSEA